MGIARETGGSGERLTWPPAVAMADRFLGQPETIGSIVDQAPQSIALGALSCGVEEIRTSVEATSGAPTRDRRRHDLQRPTA